MSSFDAELRHLRCFHLTYFLTCDEFDGLFAAAAGSCQICGISDLECWQRHRTGLYIDHFGGAPTWRVRGLLCLRCNTRLRDGSEPFNSAAARYVESAYWRKLPAAPAEPSTTSVAIRFRQRLFRQPDGLWYAGKLRKPRKYAQGLTWVESIDEYGPLLLRDPDLRPYVAVPPKANGSQPK